jgi:phosphatidylinositol alpha-1,6-mannosyltransferase
VILDDAPFVRRGPDIHPVASTFHRFASAVVAAGPFVPARYLAPVRDAPAGDPPPPSPPVDQARLEVIPTAPFRGMAGYVARLPAMVVRNRPIVDRAMRDADLVWLRVPAPNALLAERAARRHGIPHFSYVAGRTGDVVAAQDRRGLDGLVARGVARLYDAAVDHLVATGPSIVLGRDLFTSTVDEAELATTAARPAATAGVRLAWAGRIAAEKGLDDLMAAVAIQRTGGRDLEVDIIGDGPARSAVEAAARDAGVADRVRWHGFIGDRTAYMEHLRSATLFVLPSRSEGVPKVLLDAMAAGLPIVATDVGAIAEIVGEDRGRLVPAGDPAALAEAIGRSLDDPATLARMRERGLAWAAEHTETAQARRLVAWLQATFPDLGWAAAERDATHRDRDREPRRVVEGDA